MNEKEVIPCVFYFYLHCKLWEKYRKEVISTKQATSFLFEWRIPKEIRPVIIKELEMLNLVEKVNKKAIKINPTIFNIEDIRKFYSAVGIY